MKRINNVKEIVVAALFLVLGACSSEQAPVAAGGPNNPGDGSAPAEELVSGNGGCCSVQPTNEIQANTDGTFTVIPEDLNTSDIGFSGSMGGALVSGTSYTGAAARVLIIADCDTSDGVQATGGGGAACGSGAEDAVIVLDTGASVDPAGGGADTDPDAAGPLPLGDPGNDGVSFVGAFDGCGLAPATFTVPGIGDVQYDAACIGATIMEAGSNNDRSWSTPSAGGVAVPAGFAGAFVAYRVIFLDANGNVMTNPDTGVGEATARSAFGVLTPPSTGQVADVVFTLDNTAPTFAQAPAAPAGSGVLVTGTFRQPLPFGSVGWFEADNDIAVRAGDSRVVTSRRNLLASNVGVGDVVTVLSGDNNGTALVVNENNVDTTTLDIAPTGRTNISYTLPGAPIEPGTLSITDGVTTWTDLLVAGEIETGGVQQGTINYRTGEISLTAAPAPAATLEATFARASFAAETPSTLSVAGQFPADAGADVDYNIFHATVVRDREYEDEAGLACDHVDTSDANNTDCVDEVGFDRMRGDKTIIQGHVSDSQVDVTQLIVRANNAALGQTTDVDAIISRDVERGTNAYVIVDDAVADTNAQGILIAAKTAGSAGNTNAGAPWRITLNAAAIASPVNTANTFTVAGGLITAEIGQLDLGIPGIDALDGDVRDFVDAFNLGLPAGEGVVSQPAAEEIYYITTARGASANNVTIAYVDNLTDVTDPAIGDTVATLVTSSPPAIQVELGNSGAGAIIATAPDVVNAIQVNPQTDSVVKAVAVTTSATPIAVMAPVTIGAGLGGGASPVVQAGDPNATLVGALRASLFDGEDGTSALVANTGSAPQFFTPGVDPQSANANTIGRVASSSSDLAVGLVDPAFDSAGLAAGTCVPGFLNPNAAIGAARTVFVNDTGADILAGSVIARVGTTIQVGGAPFRPDTVAFDVDWDADGVTDDTLTLNPDTGDLEDGGAIDRGDFDFTTGVISNLTLVNNFVTGATVTLVATARAAVGNQQQLCFAAQMNVVEGRTGYSVRVEDAAGNISDFAANPVTEQSLRDKTPAFLATDAGAASGTTAALPSGCQTGFDAQPICVAPSSILDSNSYESFSTTVDVAGRVRDFIPGTTTFDTTNGDDGTRFVYIRITTDTGYDSFEIARDTAGNPVPYVNGADVTPALIGDFRYADIPLVPGGVTNFNVTIWDQAGNITQQSFNVTQIPANTETPPAFALDCWVDGLPQNTAGAEVPCTEDVGSFNPNSPVNLRFGLFGDNGERFVPQRDAASTDGRLATFTNNQNTQLFYNNRVPVFPAVANGNPPFLPQIERRVVAKDRISFAGRGLSLEGRLPSISILGTGQSGIFAGSLHGADPQGYTTNALTGFITTVAAGNAGSNTITITPQDLEGTPADDDAEIETPVNVATGDGATLAFGPFAGALTAPVLRGSVRVVLVDNTTGSLVANVGFDNGAGFLWDANPAADLIDDAASTVDYTTGDVSVTFTAGNAPTATQDIVFLYRTAGAAVLSGTGPGVVTADLTQAVEPGRVVVVGTFNAGTPFLLADDGNGNITDFGAGFLDPVGPNTVNYTTAGAGQLSVNLLITADAPPTALFDADRTNRDEQLRPGDHIALTAPSSNPDAFANEGLYEVIALGPAGCNPGLVDGVGGVECTTITLDRPLPADATGMNVLGEWLWKANNVPVLDEGVNEFTFFVFDTLGNSRVEPFQVLRDTQPPSVVLQGILDVIGGETPRVFSIAPEVFLTDASLFLGGINTTALVSLGTLDCSDVEGADLTLAPLTDLTVGTGDGVALSFTAAALMTPPVQPGSVEVTATIGGVTEVVAIDNGNGQLISDGAGALSAEVDPAGVNTVDYGTGDITVTFVNPPDAATDVLVTVYFGPGQRNVACLTQPASYITVVRNDDNGENDRGLPSKFGYALLRDDLATPGLVDPVATSYDVSNADAEVTANEWTTPVVWQPVDVANAPSFAPSTVLGQSKAATFASDGTTDTTAQALPGDSSCNDQGAPTPAPCRAGQPLSYQINVQAADLAGFEASATTVSDIIQTAEDRLIGGALGIISANPAVIGLLSDSTDLNVLTLDQLSFTGVLYNLNEPLAGILGSNTDTQSTNPQAFFYINSGARDDFSSLLSTILERQGGTSTAVVLSNVVRILADNGVLDDLLPIIDNTAILNPRTNLDGMGAGGDLIQGDMSRLSAFTRNLMVRNEAGFATTCGTDPLRPNSLGNPSDITCFSTEGIIKEAFPAIKATLDFGDLLTNANAGSAPRLKTIDDPDDTNSRASGSGAGVSYTDGGAGTGTLVDTAASFLPVDATDPGVGGAVDCNAAYSIGASATDPSDDVFTPDQFTRYCESVVNVQPGDIVQVGGPSCLSRGRVQTYADSAARTTLTVIGLDPACDAGVTSYVIIPSNGPALNSVIELTDILLFAGDPGNGYDNLRSTAGVTGGMDTLGGERELLLALFHLAEESFADFDASVGAGVSGWPSTSMICPLDNYVAGVRQVCDATTNPDPNSTNQNADDAESLQATLDLLFELSDDGNSANGQEFISRVLDLVKALLTQETINGSPAVVPANVEDATVLEALAPILTDLLDDGLDRKGVNGGVENDIGGLLSVPNVTSAILEPNPFDRGTILGADFNRQNTRLNLLVRSLWWLAQDDASLAPSTTLVDLDGDGVLTGGAFGEYNTNRTIVALMALVHAIVDDPTANPRGIAGRTAGGLPINSDPSQSSGQSILEQLLDPIALIVKEDRFDDLLGQFSLILDPGTGISDLTAFNSTDPVSAFPFQTSLDANPYSANPPLLRSLSEFASKNLDVDVDSVTGDVDDRSVTDKLTESLNVLLTEIGQDVGGSSQDNVPSDDSEFGSVDTPVCRENFFAGRTPVEVVLDVLAQWLVTAQQDPKDYDFKQRLDYSGGEAVDFTGTGDNRTLLRIILDGLFDDPNAQDLDTAAGDDVDDYPTNPGANLCFDGAAPPCTGTTDGGQRGPNGGDQIAVPQSTIDILPELVNTVARFGFDTTIAAEPLTSIFAACDNTANLSCAINDGYPDTTGPSISARLLSNARLGIDIALILDAPFQVGAESGILVFEQSLTRQALDAIRNLDNAAAVNYLIDLVNKIEEDIQPINATTSVPDPDDLSRSAASFRALADPNNDGVFSDDGVLDDLIPLAQIIPASGQTQQLLGLIRGIRACGYSIDDDGAEPASDVKGGDFLKAQEDMLLALLDYASGATQPFDGAAVTCSGGGGATSQRGSVGGVLDSNPLFTEYLSNQSFGACGGTACTDGGTTIPTNADPAGQAGILQGGVQFEVDLDGNLIILTTDAAGDIRHPDGTDVGDVNYDTGVWSFDLAAYGAAVNSVDVGANPRSSSDQGTLFGSARGVQPVVLDPLAGATCAAGECRLSDIDAGKDFSALGVSPGAHICFADDRSDLNGATFIEKCAQIIRVEDPATSMFAWEIVFADDTANTVDVRGAVGASAVASAGGGFAFDPQFGLCSDGAVAAASVDISTQTGSNGFFLRADLGITPGSVAFDYTDAGLGPFTGTYTDDGNGNITDGTNTGTIDYETGKVSITGLSVNDGGADTVTNASWGFAPAGCSYRIRQMAEPWNGCVGAAAIGGRGLGQALSSFSQTVESVGAPVYGLESVNAFRDARLDLILRGADDLADGDANPAGTAFLTRIEDLLETLVTDNPVTGTQSMAKLLLFGQEGVQGSGTGPVQRLLNDDATRAHLSSFLKLFSVLTNSPQDPATTTLVPVGVADPRDGYPDFLAANEWGNTTYCDTLSPVARGALAAAAGLPSTCDGNAIHDAVDYQFVALSGVLDILGDNNGLDNDYCDAFGRSGVPNNDSSIAPIQNDHCDDPEVLFFTLNAFINAGLIQNLLPGIQIIIEATDVMGEEFDLTGVGVTGAAVAGQSLGARDDRLNIIRGNQAILNRDAVADMLERLAASGNGDPVIFDYIDDALINNSFVDRFPENYAPVQCNASSSSLLISLIECDPAEALNPTDGVLGGPQQLLIQAGYQLFLEYLGEDTAGLVLGSVDDQRGIGTRRNRVVALEELLARLTGERGGSNFLLDALTILREIARDKDFGRTEATTEIRALTKPVGEDENDTIINGSDGATQRDVGPILAVQAGLAKRGTVDSAIPTRSALDVIGDFVNTLIEDPTDCDTTTAGVLDRATVNTPPNTVACPARDAFDINQFSTNANYSSDNDSVFRDVGVTLERPLQPIFDEAVFDSLAGLFAGGDDAVIVGALPFLGAVIDKQTLFIANRDGDFNEYDYCAALDNCDDDDRIGDALLADLQQLVPNSDRALLDPLLTDDLNRNGVVGDTALGGVGASSPNNDLSADCLGLAETDNSVVNCIRPEFLQDGNQGNDWGDADLCAARCDSPDPTVQTTVGFTAIDGVVTQAQIDGLDSAMLDGIADLIANEDPAFVVNNQLNRTSTGSEYDTFTTREVDSTEAVDTTFVDLITALGELLTNTRNAQ